MKNQQERRGVGRPSLGKERMYFTLSGPVVKALHKMPAGERSKFVDDLLLQHPKIIELIKSEQEHD